MKQIHFIVIILPYVKPLFMNYKKYMEPDAFVMLEKRVIKGTN
ncbi:hypothetical protein [Niabella aquatica]